MNRVMEKNGILGSEWNGKNGVLLSWKDKGALRNGRCEARLRAGGGE